LTRKKELSKTNTKLRGIEFGIHAFAVVFDDLLTHNFMILATKGFLGIGLLLKLNVIYSQPV